jgi:hypothetical protein
MQSLAIPAEVPATHGAVRQEKLAQVGTGEGGGTPARGKRQPPGLAPGGIWQERYSVGSASSALMSPRSSILSGSKALSLSK